MRIVWSPLALGRVGEIAGFIAADNGPAAARWVETLFAKVKQLASFPESGRVVPELGRDDLREIMHGSYRLIYRVSPRAIAVLTVRHGRQDLHESDVRG